MSAVDQASALRSEASPPGYDLVAVTLHWGMALLVLANLGLAVVFEDFEGAARGGLIRIHKSIGVTILALAVLRLLWRLTRRGPAPLTGLGTAARRLAGGVHRAFYALLILMPLSGWAMISADKGGRATLVWGVLPWPRIPLFVHLAPPVREQIHTALGLLHLALGVTIAALVAVHVAGALLHQFVAHEPALQRMAPRFLRRARASR